MNKIMSIKEAILYKKNREELRHNRNLLSWQNITDTTRTKAEAAIKEQEAILAEVTKSADEFLAKVEKRCTAGCFGSADTILRNAYAETDAWRSLFPASVLAGSVVKIAARYINCNSYNYPPMTTWAVLCFDKSGALVIKSIYRGYATLRDRIKPAPACAEWIASKEHIIG